LVIWLSGYLVIVWSLNWSPNEVHVGGIEREAAAPSRRVFNGQIDEGSVEHQTIK
jgi:hypothetical protein